MKLDHDSCYAALSARDGRFDGLFFVGVRTTGIYCRPVCTARTPRKDRCRFFASASGAEQAGFRPCLRCRPELAPGAAPVDAGDRIAHAAALRIEAGALNNGGRVAQLAASLGVGSRQMRRIVRAALGASPVELAQTRRLLLAKQLLTETQLSVADVAFASGFASIRRFNALFHSRYGITPSQLRSKRAHDHGGAVRLALAYRPPFAWRPLLGFLKARTIAGVEIVEDTSYARTVAENGREGWFRVSPVEGTAELSVELSISLLPALALVLSRIKQLFDLSARPDVIDGRLASDRRLAPLVRRTPGMRVPGAFDGFELALRTILGQQISVSAATTISGRLAQKFGHALETPVSGLTRASPTAARIASLDPAKLVRLGVTSARARAIVELAQAYAGGGLRLESAPLGADIETLRRLRGVGDWTAQYIAMRALRRPDAFPADDLGLLKATGYRNARALRQASASWKPWRAYAAMHLWYSLKDPKKESNQ